MRVALIDPPAYTPPYDHELAGALSRAGADVRLVTSPFRFGQRPLADGYALEETFYRRSAGISHHALRLATKAVEHPFGMWHVRRLESDVRHFQWLGAPEIDGRLLPGAPLVLTAHDLVPRRTAKRTALWRRLFSRFDRIVVHSHRGHDTLAEFGVPSDRLRVISHPVFRGDVHRADDGQTVLALGVIRDYKGLPDLVGAISGLPDARLLVAGDPRIPLTELRAQAGAQAEWRLGYLDRAAIADALGAATVAVFPYRDELDQSGALLEALGAGVPAVVYDVGGLGETVRAFGAGLVVPPGDVEGLQVAIAGLLGDTALLEQARAGAERARDELTWAASASAHLDLYRDLV